MRVTALALACVAACVAEATAAVWLGNALRGCSHVPPAAAASAPDRCSRCSWAACSSCRSRPPGAHCNLVFGCVRCLQCSQEARCPEAATDVMQILGEKHASGTPIDHLDPAAAAASSKTEWSL